MRPAYRELNKPGGGPGSRNPVVMGRKHCAECGHWRHVCDFGSARGALKSCCHTCQRLRQRRYYRNSTPEQTARRREYWRMWHEAKRREAGVPELPMKTRLKRNGHEVGQFEMAPLVEAFERSGLTAVELAARLGWVERGRADGQRVRRQLGLAPLDGEYRKHCSHERAGELCRAMDIDPFEIGL